MTAVGNALKAGLDLLKKGISAAINAVKNAVKAAIEKAKAMIAALAQFAVIIKDVAANPGAWIRNLGAAIMDGIKNHLWAALKQAISQWFNDKVESLLGLGKSVWNLLTKGGITMAQVGKMAWEAIKSAIPAALIAILVERLVSMIVPAAGAVMAIIQGLIAAWGAIQRILAAIDRFIAFLKAVKSGNAGPAFAQALAAAAVAVIEFVSQFLLRKIAGAASKVAGKIKAIAQKIGKRLMAAMKKVGKAVKKGYNKLKAKAKKAKEKIFGPKKDKDPKQDKKDEAKEKQERLDKAVAAIRPALARLLASGASGIRLKAQLLYWKVRYRLSSLDMERSGNRATFTAKVNPMDKVGDGVVPSGEDLRRIVHEVADKVLAHPDVEIAAPNAFVSEKDNLQNWQVGPNTHGYLGWVAEQRRRGTPPAGTWQYTQIGSTGVDVKEKRVHETGSAHDLRISGAGAYTPGSNALKGLDAEIMRVGKEMGLEEADTATMLRQFATTQTFPKGLPDNMQKMLATRAHLLFGRENARNAGEVAFSAMTVDRIEQGDLSWKDAFNKPGALAKDTDIDRQLTTGGENPMSFRGSSRAADDMTLGGVPADVTAPKERERREKGVEELKRREIAMAENWLKMKMTAEGQIYFDDEAHARQWIYDQLLTFFSAKAHTLPNT
jgi:hypothetical protein